MTSALNLSAPFLMELVDTLDRMGPRGATVHPESGPGQFEVSIRHAPALAAADSTVLFRDACAGSRARHGLAASFAAKPFPDKVAADAISM